VEVQLESVAVAIQVVTAQASVIKKILTSDQVSPGDITTSFLQKPQAIVADALKHSGGRLAKDIQSLIRVDKRKIRRLDELYQRRAANTGRGVELLKILDGVKKILERTKNNQLKDVKDFNDQLRQSFSIPMSPPSSPPSPSLSSVSTVTDFSIHRNYSAPPDSSDFLPFDDSVSTSSRGGSTRRAPSIHDGLDYSAGPDMASAYFRARRRGSERGVAIPSE
jgi:hypothetical protein